MVVLLMMVLKVCFFFYSVDRYLIRFGAAGVNVFRVLGKPGRTLDALASYT